MAERRLRLNKGKMHVLIADKFEQSGRDGLQAIGCEVNARRTPTSADGQDDGNEETTPNSTSP